MGLPSGWTLENSAGLGLSVTKERIRGLHSEGAGRFTVRRLRQGTEAAILIPLRHSADEAREAGYDSAAD